MSGKTVNTKIYNKLVREIDAVLESKRISYASFSQMLGIHSIAFYNRYKTYGFTPNDLQQFLEIAKVQPPKMIRCLKCGKEFLPKAKSVKRAFCDECRVEMRRKNESNEVLRFKYPVWVTGVSDWDIRNLVEQEYHIDEETAMAMSEAQTVEEARTIRAERWKSNTQGVSSVVYNSLNDIKIMY